MKWPLMCTGRSVYCGSGRKQNTWPLNSWALLRLRGAAKPCFGLTCSTYFHVVALFSTSPMPCCISHSSFTSFPLLTCDSTIVRGYVVMNGVLDAASSKDFIWWVNSDRLLQAVSSSSVL